MNKMNNQTNESDHFGNDWGFYIDIENYKYSIDTHTNKIIKRNKIYNNDYGIDYDYDYDYELDYYYYNPRNNQKEDIKATKSFMKITSVTLITATVSFMLFYMS